ncbi:MAG: hypothetical protein ACU843_10430 [Gammaproteobacteria bacterium]
MTGPALLIVLIRLQHDSLGASLHPEYPIVWLRTFGYALAIILFPIIGGIRRRAERKQQVEPHCADTAPQSCARSGPYLAGLVVSLILAEVIALFGFYLFLCGDNLQTVYIFIGLSILAILLQRPGSDSRP